MLSAGAALTATAAGQHNARPGLTHGIPSLSPAMLSTARPAPTGWVKPVTGARLYRSSPPGRQAPIAARNFSDSWNLFGLGPPLDLILLSRLRWWAPGLFALLLTGSFLSLVKKYRNARQQADELHQTAEWAMDNLEDQLQLQQRCIHNTHAHAEHLLKIVSELLQLQADQMDDPILLEAATANQQRLKCLQLLQANLHYLGDRLEVDFQRALEQLLDGLFPYRPRPTLEIIAINSVTAMRLPVHVAMPALLIVNELAGNSCAHAFTAIDGAHAVQVQMEDNGEANGWTLAVADGGSGLPDSINPTRPTTTSMALIAVLAEELGATIHISRDRGTRFSLEIPKQADSYAPD